MLCRWISAEPSRDLDLVIRENCCICYVRRAGLREGVQLESSQNQILGQWPQGQDWIQVHRYTPSIGSIDFPSCSLHRQILSVESMLLHSEV